MIPLKLALRNFLGYRELDPPLDFTGIHVACLAGPNGAGKSALLDAITWALWGRARAKSDDELVTLGQTEMQVELEFALGEERYRVLRTRTRPGIRKAGQSLLELQVAEGGYQETQFRPITGNSLRETQRRIEELLRLDYHTFINSALLLQGRADEFTLKAPGERKRVLGEVLGLSRYDAYEEQAKNEARRGEAELATLRADIASLDAQVSLQPHYEEALRAAQTRHQQLDALSRSQERALVALQESQRLLAEMRARLAEAQVHAQQAEAELREATERETALRERIREYKSVLAQKEAVERALEEYEAVSAANDMLGRALQALLPLREDEARLERAVEGARSQLLADQRMLTQEVGRLQQVVATRPSLQEKLRAAEEQLAAHAEQEGDRFSQKARLEELSQEIGILQHSNTSITQQGTELRAKVAQLSRPGDTDVCPLCGSVLGSEGHERILLEYQQELERQRDLYRANEGRQRQRQEEQQRRQTALQALEEAIAAGRSAAQKSAAVAAQGLVAVEQAASEAAEAEARLQRVQSDLTAKAYAPDAQRNLAETSGRIAALGYGQEKHRAVQERLKALQAQAAVAQRLREAERRLPEEEADLARTQEAAARWRGRLAEESDRCAALQRELARLPDLNEESTHARQELEATRGRFADAGRELGRAQAEVDRCILLGRMLQGRRQDVSGMEREKGIYDELAVAFGRRGVQALLIETALPELEAEANRLLSRLTDSGLTLKLETQRQSRAGGTIETLDIIIGDEMGGTRAYELYSGGEAFRINFALRVALSKLLTRRVGAPLATLIIDEGFGTQDTAGREKLVEAIGAIAQDFHRVLVVTHIDELKDAFPVRIEVTKTSEGSRVEVVHS